MYLKFRKRGGDFLGQQEAQLQEALDKHKTWQVYRCSLKVPDRNKLISCVDQDFGIFPSHEVLMLGNLPFYKTEAEFNMIRRQIYAKDG